MSTTLKAAARRRTRWLSAAVAITACTPAFHAGESDDDGARAGAGGSSDGSAGRALTTGGSGGTQSGHAGMPLGGGPASGGSNGSGARGGSNGSGGMSGHGGTEPGTGGRSDSGATGGTDAQGGTDVTGGRAPQGGAGPLGGRATAGEAGALGAGMSGGGMSPGGGRGGLPGIGGIGGLGLAGVSGAGGAAMPCTPALVVDDMEDGDALTCPNQGRAGDWWTATGTPTGAIDPPTHGNFPAYALGADARPGSTYGMRFAGTSFGHTDDDWASLGFYLAGEDAYDLTPYQGLAFYAKSKSGTFELNVEFATNTTTPTGDGGSCTTDCTDHYKGVVTLDVTWKEYVVPFDTLAQEGWGVKPKDLAHALFVYFGFLGTDGGPANFEFLVDDVRLY